MNYLIMLEIIKEILRYDQIISLIKKNCNNVRFNCYYESPKEKNKMNVILSKSKPSWKLENSEIHELLLSYIF